MNADFFNNLPKPGQYVMVPGGVVWCDRWEVNYTRDGESNGEIVFYFRVDADHVSTAMPTPALPEPVRELPAPPLALTAAQEDEVDPPSIFECIDVIAAKMGVSSDACRMALFSQSVDLGVLFEELVHKQYRTAIGLEGDDHE